MSGPNQNNPTNPNRQRLGGMWNKQSSNGNNYFSIKLDREALLKLAAESKDISLTVYLSDKKNTEYSPDFNVYYYTPNGGTQQNAKPAAVPAKKPVAPVKPKTAPVEEVEEDSDFNAPI